MMNKKNSEKSKKTYKLSENSKSAGNDFATANHLASLLYTEFRNASGHMPDADCYKRLLLVVVKILRSDYKSPVGKKKLQQGNLSLLNSFRLSKRRYFNTIVRSMPHVDISTEIKTIKVYMPCGSLTELINRPPRATRLKLIFYAFAIDLGTQRSESFITNPIYIDEESPNKTRIVPFEFDKLNNCLVMVIGICQFHLHEKQNKKKEFASNNRLHFAAEVIETAAIKNNKVITYREQPAEKIVPQAMQTKKVDWEEDN